MKVVIPGGSGQVGAILARALHADGHDVVVLTRQPHTSPWRTVAWDGATSGPWATVDCCLTQPGGSDGMTKYGELIDVRRIPLTIRVSAGSGLAWALIAWFVGYRALGYRIWGGSMMAPLIGILIGRLSWSLHNKARWVQIAGSLFYLYVAASCFALGMALFSAVVDSRNVKFSATLMQHVLAVLWGLTFGGYALVLWPLSFFNHGLVWQADAGQIPAPPAVRTASPAIRSLAVRIMALSVLGYAAWALFQAVLATVGSSASTMPWWIVTGLMGWSKCFVLGIVVWLSAPVLAFSATLAADSEERSTATYAELIGLVGFAVFAFPLLFFAASLIVTAIKVSLVQSWTTEGTVFWASSYYRNVFQMYLPWFLVGGGMIGVRRLIRVRW